MLVHNNHSKTAPMMIDRNSLGTKASFRIAHPIMVLEQEDKHSLSLFPMSLLPI